MEQVFAIGNHEASTNEMLDNMEAECHRRLRREAQRTRRAAQDDSERKERIRAVNTAAHVKMQTLWYQGSDRRKIP
ncbi:hypothetical protein MVEN_00682500 [Mycena venus]|uniref:Uncharacterized protein n=1 Tax=Mycena venus TaxID=2733690 RepID=A0A8H6YH07_9AGAR|nr:hypothetical protein MVEN_00682500 [Mycena venus]